MKLLIFILTAVMAAFCYASSYAAYPVQQRPEVGQVQASHSVTLQTYRISNHLPAAQPTNRGKGKATGILSLGLGIGGIVVTLAGGVLGAQILAFVGFLCGIGAIVAGILGLKGPQRGYAIAGLVLGILQVAILGYLFVAVLTAFK